MKKSQEILSFVIADLNRSLSPRELQGALLKVIANTKREESLPYHFFKKDGLLFSIALSHELNNLEKLKAISQNGKINIINKKVLLDIGYNLDFSIQKKIRTALAADAPIQSINNDITSLPDSSVEQTRNILFTIGYEGYSVDLFFKKIIENGIKKIIDVRKNPISRKFGFSKKILASASTMLGISYEHFPDLGIPSESRKELKSQEDYNRLFEDYERNILSKTALQQDLMTKSIQEKTSALLCYELNTQQCHRIILANAIGKRIKFPIKNI